MSLKEKLSYFFGFATTANLTGFQTFINDLTASSVYKNWASKNSAEATKWTTFYKAILAGQAPVPPVMSTAFGRALVDAAKLAMVTPAARPGIYGTTTYGDSTYE